MLAVKMSLNGSPQSMFPSIAPPSAKGSPERSTSQKRGTGGAATSVDGASVASGFSPAKSGRATERSLPKLVNEDGDPGSSSEDAARKKVTMVQQISRISNEDNPEPLPYQPQYFKSSTLLKMVSVPGRHQATFGQGRFTNRKKGIIVHSERYQWNQKPNTEALLQQQSMLAPLGFTEPKTVSRFSQRDRLLAERAYMEKMRGIKRKREILSHREPKDLLMQSARAEFSERFDVKDELNRLKSIVLPVNARELYHGKGISLPTTHSSVKPRPRPPPHPSVSRRSAPAVNKSAATPTLLTESEAEDDGAQNNYWSVTHRAESEMEIDIPTEPVLQSLSVANSMAASPAKAVTPNPLKVLDLTILVTDDENRLLAETFRRLDSDKDGHVTYVQAKNIIPKDVTAPEERFLKQVYDLTSASTYFGVSEFVTFSCLCQEMSKLSGICKDAYGRLDFSCLHECLLQYVELFDSNDNGQKGSIAMDCLEDILCTSLTKDKTEDHSTLLEIRQFVNPEMDENISKVKYLAHVPYFLTFETT